MTSLAAVVATADAVSGTTKRTAKRDLLADLLREVDPAEVAVVVGFLVGELRQGRIGVAWASVSAAAAAAAAAEAAAESDGDEDGDRSAPLTVSDVDLAVTRIAAATGPGSRAQRHRELTDLLRRASGAEADFLSRLFVGEMRTGALEGVTVDAVARAFAVELPVLRRAVMLAGDLGRVAQMAAVGGMPAVAAVGLEVLRPVQPMLASPATGVTEAVDALGLVSVEWKLDGARIQVHRHGDEVRVFTRNLNEVTDRLAEVVAVVRSLPVQSIVLDGEIMGPDGSDGPGAFQDTMSDFSTADRAAGSLRPWFFDVIHLDGVDLLDLPWSQRRPILERLLGEMAIPSVVTDNPLRAAAMLEEALDAGHEGVMVKGADSVYEAGRRGSSWRKVKPVHTLDLVVLAVEWGHGRRRGLLSNLHLGALDPDTGAPVMVGKTFKGMTDALLAWQTERFTALAERESESTVWVRPEQVVEIAVDGAQASTRYPGGVALRFARVVGYRSDKPASDADALDAVRDLLPRSRRVDR